MKLSNVSFNLFPSHAQNSTFVMYGVFCFMKTVIFCIRFNIDALTEECANFIDRQASLQAVGGKPVTMAQWIELIQVRINTNMIAT